MGEELPELLQGVVCPYCGRPQLDREGDPAPCAHVVAWELNDGTGRDGGCYSHEAIRGCEPASFLLGDLREMWCLLDTLKDLKDCRVPCRGCAIPFRVVVLPVTGRRWDTASGCVVFSSEPTDLIVELYRRVPVAPILTADSGRAPYGRAPTAARAEEDHQEEEDLSEKAEWAATPESLMRLSQGACRIESALSGKDFGWVWALRWCSWSLLLECSGASGRNVRTYCPGLWGMGKAGKRLLRAVVRGLRQRGVLRLEGSRAFVVKGEETARHIGRLWRWLESHTRGGAA